MKIDQLENRSGAVYKNWKIKFKENKNVVQKLLTKQLSEPTYNYDEKSIHLLNAKQVFEQLNFAGQQKLVRIIFQAGLTYDGKIFRTPFLHPVFNQLLSSSNVCHLLQEKQAHNDLKNASLSYDEISCY